MFLIIGPVKCDISVKRPDWSLETGPFLEQRSVRRNYARLLITTTYRYHHLEHIRLRCQSDTADRGKHRHCLKSVSQSGRFPVVMKMKSRQLRTASRRPVKSGITRYCSRCKGKVQFVDSGKLRQNANGKTIFTYAIYKCAKGHTWNKKLTIRKA